MGLSQALHTGVSGLVSHQKALDNIGNNLANINTVGYKKGVYQFATLLEQSLQSGMSASGNRGSVNPIAIGLGTQTGSINKVFAQGSLETTGSSTDMAIYGNGFFVVSTGSGYAYTRDGSFYISEDGYLMGGNGYYVQGTMAVTNADGSISIPQDAKLQNLVIPIGATGGMSKTSTVAFTGNLDSTQSVYSGLNLFGSNAPTVNSLQAWMNPNYASGSNADTSWNALEEKAYVTIKDSGLTNVTHVYYATDTDGTVKSVADLGFGSTPALVSDVQAAGYTPMVEAIQTINGGNVNTSQAMGIVVPSMLAQGSYSAPNGRTYDIQNTTTYPMWFYESTCAGIGFTEIVELNNGLAAAGSYPYTHTASDGSAHTFNNDAEVYAYIWPNGINNDGLAVTGLPVKDETYAASLNTPLEQLYVYQGNKWTQLFPNISDGDEVTISFDKGEGSITATFIYNRPNYLQAVGNQQKVDYEQSYTLEHFLIFLAGDVDDPGRACAAITPAMFGAQVTADFPDGDPDSATFDEAAYNAALANLTLAQSDSNTNTNGGAMGLIDVGAQISAANGGTDAYDTPMETAGAFSRTTENTMTYLRWNGTEYEEVKGNSFLVSLVSNLGAENALSNISINYNNVTNKTVFSAETQYSAAQGGSGSASVTYYDSLGNAHTCTVRMALVSEDSTGSTWRWYADCTDDTDFAWQVDPNTGEIISNLNVGTGVFRFDTDGNFIAGSDYSETTGIVINLVNQGVDDTIHVSILNGLSSKETQNLDFSTLTYTATKNSLTLSEQDGSPPGSLESFSVGLDGTISGVYSTGKTVPLGRLVLATVPNMNGMTAGSDNLFYTSPASGAAQIGYPELGGRGEIRQNQLETSNVDMSEEFTKMIAIERGYQANSRIITTADEMLQELLSMVR